MKTQNQTKENRKEKILFFLLMLLSYYNLFYGALGYALGGIKGVLICFFSVTFFSVLGYLTYKYILRKTI